MAKIVKRGPLQFMTGSLATIRIPVSIWDSPYGNGEADKKIPFGESPFQKIFRVHLGINTYISTIASNKHKQKKFMCIKTYEFKTSFGSRAFFDPVLGPGLCNANGSTTLQPPWL